MNPVFSLPNSYLHPSDDFGRQRPNYLHSPSKTLRLIADELPVGVVLRDFELFEPDSARRIKKALKLPGSAGPTATGFKFEARLIRLRCLALSSTSATLFMGSVLRRLKG